MMPVSEAKTGADAPGDPALVARGLVAGRRGGPGHRGYRLRLAPPRHHHHRRPAGRAGRGGAVERLLGPGVERRRPDRAEYWGDLKYVGVVLLPRPTWPSCSSAAATPAGRWVGPALALEPLAVLLLLAATATHDLVRYYPPGATIATALAAEAGRCSGPT